MRFSEFSELAGNPQGRGKFSGKPKNEYELTRSEVLSGFVLGLLKDSLACSHAREGKSFEESLARLGQSFRPRCIGDAVASMCNECRARRTPTKRFCLPTRPSFPFPLVADKNDCKHSGVRRSLRIYCTTHARPVLGNIGSFSCQTRPPFFRPERTHRTERPRPASFDSDPLSPSPHSGMAASRAQPTFPVLWKPKNSQGVLVAHSKTRSVSEKSKYGNTNCIDLQSHALAGPWTMLSNELASP